MHNTPLAVRLFDTKVGVEFDYLLSCNIASSCLALKKSSMKLNASFAKVHCRATEYLVPGTDSISWRAPLSEGKTEGGSRHTTSWNTLTKDKSDR